MPIGQLVLRLDGSLGIDNRFGTDDTWRRGHPPDGGPQIAYVGARIGYAPTSPLQIRCARGMRRPWCKWSYHITSCFIIPT